MSVSEVAAPPKKRSFLRVWLPLLILVAASAAVAVIRFGPFPEWEPANRNVSTMFTVLVTSALLLVWFALFSGLRWVWRVAVIFLVAVLVGSAVGSVRNVGFSGDMLPILEFRWQRSAEDVLRESREKSGSGEQWQRFSLMQASPGSSPSTEGATRRHCARGPPVLGAQAAASGLATAGGGRLLWFRGSWKCCRYGGATRG